MSGMNLAKYIDIVLSNITPPATVRFDVPLNGRGYVDDSGQSRVAFTLNVSTPHKTQADSLPVQEHTDPGQTQ